MLPLFFKTCQLLFAVSDGICDISSLEPIWAVKKGIFLVFSTKLEAGKNLQQGPAETETQVYEGSKKEEESVKKTRR